MTYALSLFLLGSSELCNDERLQNKNTRKKISNVLLTFFRFSRFSCSFTSNEEEDVKRASRSGLKLDCPNRKSAAIFFSKTSSARSYRVLGVFFFYSVIFFAFLRKERALKDRAASPVFIITITLQCYLFTKRNIFSFR